MKKILTFLMIAVLAVGCLFGIAACGDNSGNGGKGTSRDRTPVTDKASLSFAYDNLCKSNEFADPDNGLTTANDLVGARFFIGGEYLDTYTKLNTRKDIKVEFLTDKYARIANVSAGTVFTLPFTDYDVDYSIAKYRIQYKFGDSILTATAEASNPYTGALNPWYTYGGEWLLEHINNENYYTRNNLELINGTHVYNFTASEPHGDLETKAGYDLYRYDVKVNPGPIFDKDHKEIEGEEGEVEYPYYNIAIIRPAGDVKNFAMFVMKSKEDQKEVMDFIVKSFRKLSTTKGILKNYLKIDDPTPNPNWSAETKEYFDLLMDASTVDWGCFNGSLPEWEGTLHEGEASYDAYYNRLKTYKETVEDIWGYNYDIYPTYGHMAWGYNQTWYFPLEMAKAFAGGNGKNGKPILQYTYQFTVNDNNTLSMSTPMWDILRGSYDEKFHNMAKDVKAYGKPILFRLNNEMNTDWTSYCGMMTLLDPDVFNMTWRRMADIFTEEGVDNVIWIWNPQDVSCPYSSWGEDLCYFPGTDYVQVLGGTSYEMNNYTTESEREAAKTTFETYYSKLYNKNSETFKNWGMVISEFGCASGGDSAGYELGRNRDVQAKWIEHMFNILTKENDKPEWAKSIKGAVWFNANDAGPNGTILNRIRFCKPEGDTDPYDYDDLVDTWAAFKAGFAKEKALKEKLLASKK